MEPIGIYQWVSKNNPDPTLSYGKGWWDHIEFLYHLDALYGENKTTVVSTHEMFTPPPQETLLMPVVRLETEPATFIMKRVFDGIDKDWTVSVIRDSVARLPLYGLIDEHEELVADKIDGFAAEWVFPYYAKSQARFTARIRDDWQLYAFLWVIAHT